MTEHAINPLRTARSDPMSPSSIQDVHDLESAMTDAWSSVDLATVNGNAVRLRVMTDVAAEWHVHENSDELFHVLSGDVYLDTEHGTHKITPGKLFVIPAATRHRARVVGRAAMLVIDQIGHPVLRSVDKAS
jgi:mannose-6-phosphate isomerase-like protein (cupin superfamily)